MTVLEKILANKAEEVGHLKANTDIDSLRRQAADAAPARNMIAALRACGHVPIIAEIKRASPSMGTINDRTDVASQARSYEKGGAAGLSVLTDGPFFQGKLEDLCEARSSVALPVLRKDFIIDSIQLYQSRAAGADAILLIAAALGLEHLRKLYLETVALGMTPIVEVHAESELSGVMALDPVIVGINNRNLRTMEVSLETCVRLRPLIPERTLVLAESGIKGPEDVASLLDAGVDAFLVGTTLMKSGDPEGTLARLCRVGD
jgi:indole-3-glycerol phosphate synthase